MESPITYYGGKKSMLNIILPMIPAHSIYCEPFFGGGAVFFAKMPVSVEIINDINGNVVNFYRIMQNNFTELQKEIRCTLHSRTLYNQAKDIYRNPSMYSEIKRAWAFWTLANQGFGGAMNSSWSYDNGSNSVPKKLQRKRTNFTIQYAARLETTQIESIDAVRLIRLRDSENTFFYCDPPYFNANMGHYSGYTEDNYKNLLTALAEINGRFLLSSYPSLLLSQYIAQYGWHSIEIQRTINIKNKSISFSKTKTEVLTANYPLRNEKQLKIGLFDK